MATTASVTAWRTTASSVTVRQFTCACLWAAGLLVLGCGLYVIEKYVLQLDSRFVENPADVIMRAMAMAHFFVGWLFLFTSPRIRNKPALVRISLATLLGVALCWLFASYGATRNPWLLVFFYGYFVLHEIRDETVLYRLYGDGPKDGPEADRLLPALRQAACGVLFAALVTAYVMHAVTFDKAATLAKFPDWAFYAGLPASWFVATWLILRAARIGRELHGSVAATCLAHRPLLLVYAGILATLLVGSAFGSTGLNLIILIHVTAWLVFTQYQLAARPMANEALGLWGWLRRTPTGFVVLHLGLMVLCLGFMAIRVHVWQRVGLGSELLASANFCYWALMHITMAFWSSK